MQPLGCVIICTRIIIVCCPGPSTVGSVSVAAAAVQLPASLNWVLARAAQAGPFGVRKASRVHLCASVDDREIHLQEQTHSWHNGSRLHRSELNSPSDSRPCWHGVLNCAVVTRGSLTILSSWSREARIEQLRAVPLDLLTTCPDTLLKVLYPNYA